MDFLLEHNILIKRNIIMLYIQILKFTKFLVIPIEYIIIKSIILKIIFLMFIKIYENMIWFLVKEHVLCNHGDHDLPRKLH